MAQFPAFPLWTDAYLADTSHLTTLEHGAYMLLLMTMWRGGGTLPNDDRKLAKYAGVQSNQWARIKHTIMEFMTVSDDGQFVTQGRLSDELQYVRDHAKKQAKNARSRWQKNTAPPEVVEQHPADPLNDVDANSLANKDMDDATASFWQCQPDAPTPTPIIVDTNVSTLSEIVGKMPKGRKRTKNGYTPDYEALWKAYPSTEGQSKLNGFTAWQKLSAADQAQAMASIPAYAALLKRSPDRVVKHVQGYLNGRMFESFAAAPQPEDWGKRLTYGRQWKQWPVHQWGPMPSQPGCRVPAELLAEGDGAGWIEARAA